MPVKVFYRLQYIPESKDFEFVFDFGDSNGTHVVSRATVKEWIAVLRSDKACVLKLPDGNLRMDAPRAARGQLAEYFELVLESPE